MKSINKAVAALVTLGVLVVIIIAVGYFLPERTRFEHATYIDVAPETVYNLMADPGRFERWVPWQAADETVRYHVDEGGPGLNAALHWESDRAAVGSGRMTVIDAQPHRKLRLLLDYDNNGQAILSFRLEALEGGTHIVWSYEREHGANPLSRYKGLLHQRRVDGLYNPSLDRLRRLAESRPEQSAAAVVTETVDYEVDGRSFTGYLAYDENRRNRPGVLIVHEWWGHTDYVRERAEQLAGLGYVAFALDMYGDGRTADHPDKAGEWAGRVKEDFGKAEKRFTAALDLLKDHPATDPEQTAAIGYCFGGGVVLNMARAGADLDAAVSFHGSLEPINEKAERGDIRASLLVLNGADDPMVPKEQVQAFMQEMDNAGADYELINYPGAKHAFTNPAADEYAEQFDLPVAYNAAADKQSWQKMRDFFGRVFRKE